MAVFVNPKTGERYANVPDADADKATAFGLVPEAQAQAEERSGGLLGALRGGAEEGIRQVASGGAAALRGMSSFGSDAELDPMGNPITSTAPTLDVKGADLAPGVYTDAALERRQVNPTATAIGGALPAVAAGVMLPGAGAAGLVSTLGLDAASAAAQEATDAELAGEGINGSHILRNAALNSLFSGAAGAIPIAARALVRGADDVVTRAAKFAAAKLEEFGGDAIAKKATTVLTEADDALNAVKMPKVTNNPNAQRAALEDIADAFEKTSPEAKTVRDLAAKPGPARYKGLQDLASELPEDAEIGKSITETLQRPDLWGTKAVDFHTDLASARALKPAEGAGPEAWQAYADAIRKLPDDGLVKRADLLSELAQAKALDGLSVAGLGSKAAASLGNTVVGIGAEEAVETGFKGVGAAIGGALGGTPGLAAGWLAGRALNKKFGERVVEGISGSAGRALGGGTALNSGSAIVKAAVALKQFAEQDRRLTAHLLVNPDAAQKMARVLGDTGDAMQRFRGDDESNVQAFQRHQQTLRQYAQDPSSMISLLGEEMGNIDESSPTLYRQMTAKAVEISNYLQEQMPKPNGVSVARPQGTPPSPMAIRQYALKFSAATSPSSVMADARAGRLRREQVETLKQLWPDEYSGLRQHVLEQLGRGSTTQTRQRMNLLFGFDSSVDPALGARVRGIVAAARKSAAAQLGPSKPNSSYAPQTPPSQAGMMPAGEAALQLGPSLG